MQFPAGEALSGINFTMDNVQFNNWTHYPFWL